MPSIPPQFNRRGKRHVRTPIPDDELQATGALALREGRTKLTKAQHEDAKRQCWELSARGVPHGQIASILRLTKETVSSLLQAAADERKPWADEDAIAAARMQSQAIKQTVIESAWADWSASNPGSQTRSFFLNVILTASRDLDKINGLIIERRNTVDDKGKLTTETLLKLGDLLNTPITIEVKDAGDTSEFE